MKQTSQFKTKLEKDSKTSVITVVTYTFPNTMPLPLISGWIDSANIRLQAKFRREGKIPQRIDIDALEFASSTGSRSQPVTKESVTAMMGAFTPAQLEQMVKDAHKKEAEEAKGLVARTRAAARAAGKKNKPHPQAKPSGTTVPSPVQPGSKSDGDKNDQPEYIDTP